MAKKRDTRSVRSYEVLELYARAVREDWPYQGLLAAMVDQLGMKDAKSAEARLHRLNNYLRKNFDGAELETLRGAPQLPKTTKRLHALFSDAVIRNSIRSVRRRVKELEEEAAAK